MVVKSELLYDKG
jgi:hypothetical protein